MDLTKLGGKVWFEEVARSSLPSSKSTEMFLQDTALAHSVSDILKISRNQRNFVSPKEAAVSPNVDIDTKGRNVTTREHPGGNQGRKLHINALRQTAPIASYSVSERPPNRGEISALENDLDKRMRAIFQSEETNLKAIETGELYQPHRDTIYLVRDRIFSEFKTNNDDLDDEPWMLNLIHSESLMDVCDSVSTKLADMISVSSTGLGTVMRKLKRAYERSFAEIRTGWIELRTKCIASEEIILRYEQRIQKLEEDLQDQADEIENRIENEVGARSDEFALEIGKEREKLSTAERKLEQMSETLRSLNAIFKTMQADGGNSSRAADLVKKNERLEKENEELSAECIKLDKLKQEMRAMQEKLDASGSLLASRDEEIEELNLKILRRDETVSELMEKEALRNAEIDRLKMYNKLQEDKDAEMDAFQEQATSVLCVRCKKSLDDLSNIKAAVTGHTNGQEKKTCEFYRILLPNLKGRKPDRSTAWLRNVMRATLFSKMREDVSLHGIKGDAIRFPQFVYAWFDRSIEATTGPAFVKARNEIDDDRWGMYYGVKALANSGDAEALVYWSLLNEAFDEDGTQFVLHCLSVILSLTSFELWRQLDLRVLMRGGSYDAMFFGVDEGGLEALSPTRVHSHSTSHRQVQSTIWVEVEAAKEAVRTILSRALASHIADAVEAIDALRETPVISEETLHDAEDGEADVDERTSAVSAPPTEPQLVGQSDSATHISLFILLRLLLQSLQSEKLHRTSAIRLMFETASMGAMVPDVGGDKKDSSESKDPDSKVHFPQFQAICKTLFPFISIVDAAGLFIECHIQGDKKVNADIFLRISDRKGLFSKAMHFSSLPLMLHHAPTDNDAINSNEESTAAKARESGGHMKNTLAQQKMRVSLGALVHRKMTAISPEIRLIVKSLPEKWSVMLLEAEQAVYNSLQDSFSMMRDRSGFEKGTPNRGSTHPGTRGGGKPIDGLQPFVHYRRLLSLSVLLKALVENPLLPGELFDVKNRSELPNVKMGIKRAEQLLTSLEEALVVSSTTRSHTLAKSLHARFENACRNLLARRIQRTMRNFMRSIVSAVPQSVRLNMRPGYTHGAHQLKSRTFLLSPIWAQESIAAIIHFKASHDAKASQLGLAPIDLGLATTSFMYWRWGSVDVAEKNVHDLFFTVGKYSGFVPRFRLFKAFLATDVDLDNSVALMLQTPPAVAVYLRLICEIHATRDDAELARALGDSALPKADSTCKGGVLYDPDELPMVDSLPSSSVSTPEANEAKTSSASSPPDIDPQVEAVKEPEPDREAEIEGEEEARAGEPKRTSIKALFPSSASFAPPELTGDGQKDTWLEPRSVLRDAVERWALGITGLDNKARDYMGFLVDKLKHYRFEDAPDALAYIDVDELLWVTMLQWAKYAVWFVKRSISQAGLKESEAQKRRANMEIQMLMSGSSLQTVHHQRQINSASRSLTLPISSISGLAESAFRPGEGARMIDSAALGSLYLPLFTGLRSPGTWGVLGDISPHARMVSACAGVVEGSAGSGSKANTAVSVKLQCVLAACVLWSLNVAAPSTDHVGAAVVAMSETRKETTATNFAQQQPQQPQQLQRVALLTSFSSHTEPRTIFRTVQIARSAYVMPVAALVSLIAVEIKNMKEPDEILDSHVAAAKGYLADLDAQIELASQAQQHNNDDTAFLRLVLQSWSTVQKIISMAAELTDMVKFEPPLDQVSSEPEPKLSPPQAYYLVTRNNMD